MTKYMTCCKTSKFKLVCTVTCLLSLEFTVLQAQKLNNQSHVTHEFRDASNRTYTHVSQITTRPSTKSVDQLIKVFKKKQLDHNDLRIISNLYYKQPAKVRIAQQMSEEIGIRRFRQGGVLSQLLSNANSEEIFNKALEREIASIRVK